MVSQAHDGGQIVALGNTVLVGGGFDPHSAETKPTDVVDVITISSAA